MPGAFPLYHVHVGEQTGGRTFGGCNFVLFFIFVEILCACIARCIVCNTVA